MAKEIRQIASGGLTTSPDPINPFLIPHVADKILSHLHRPDLLMSRLVCKQWANSASYSLRKKSELHIGHYFTKVKKFAQLVDLAKNSDHIFATRFMLNQDIFKNDNSQLVSDFLRTFSPVLESLSLWMDLKSTLKFDDNFFETNNLLKKNLKFQKLRKICMYDQRGMHSVMNCAFEDSGPKLLTWLVTNSPSLEQLSIRFDRELSNNNMDEIDGGHVHDILMTLFLDFSNLNRLNLDVHLNDELITRLCEGFTSTRKIPRLNCLKLTLKGSRISSQAFHRLMCTLRYRLEELSLLLLTEETGMDLHFPRMDVLTLFEINGVGSSYRNINFHPVLYKEQFPSLKRLILDTWRKHDTSSDWDSLIQAKHPVTTLQELRLPDETATFSRFIQISRTFPNLRKLEIKIAAEDLKTLELIFENLMQLVCLKVRRSWTSNGMNNNMARNANHRGGNIDHILTGIPFDICDLLRRRLSSAPYLSMAFSQIQDKLKLIKDRRGRPGLTNLKCLKRLELHDFPHMVEISDISGYFAFLEMECLEYLDVNRSMMSRPCVKVLAEKFPSNMKPQMRSWTSDKAIQSESDEVITNDNWVMFPGKCNYL